MSRASLSRQVDKDDEDSREPRPVTDQQAGESSDHDIHPTAARGLADLLHNSPERRAQSASDVDSSPRLGQGSEEEGLDGSSGATSSESSGDRSSSSDWTYTLEIIQQPQRARACGFGDKDRRPLSPPPILRLRVYHASGEPVDPSQISIQFLLVMVDLWSGDHAQRRNVVLHPSSLVRDSLGDDTDASRSLSNSRPTTAVMPSDSTLEWQAGPSKYAESLERRGYQRLDTQQFFPFPSDRSEGSSRESHATMGNPPGPQYPATTVRSPRGGVYYVPSVPPPSADAPNAYYETRPDYSREEVSSSSSTTIREMPDYRIPGSSTSTHSHYNPPDSQLDVHDQARARPILTPGMSSSTSTASSPSPHSRVLVGSLTSICQRLKDENDQLGLFFFAHDLGIRTEGVFSLKFSLVNLTSLMQVNATVLQSSEVLTEVFSDPLTVYSAKRFPGVIPTTDLTRHFAGQNVRLPTRQKRTVPDEDVESGEAEEEE